MTEENQNFTMYEGNTKVIRCDSGIVDEDNGGVVDISGDEITWTLSRYEGAPSTVTKSVSGGDVTILDGGAGTFEVQLNPADTEGVVGNREKRFWHEAQLDDAYESTVTTGYITIKPSSVPE